MVDKSPSWSGDKENMRQNGGSRQAKRKKKKSSKGEQKMISVKERKQPSVTEAFQVTIHQDNALKRKQVTFGGHEGGLDSVEVPLFLPPN